MKNFTIGFPYNHTHFKFLRQPYNIIKNFTIPFPHNITDFKILWQPYYGILDIIRFSTRAVIFMVICVLLILSVAGYHRYSTVPTVDPPRRRRGRRRRVTDKILLDNNQPIMATRIQYTRVQTRAGSHGQGLTSDQHQLTLIRQQATRTKLHEIRRDKGGVYVYPTNILWGVLVC